MRYLTVNLTYFDKRAIAWVQSLIHWSRYMALENVKMIEYARGGHANFDGGNGTVTHRILRVSPTCHVHVW